MAFTKITEADLTGKGVIGLPDTPGLSTSEMQEKFDEIALDVLYPKHNGLIDELEATTAAGNIAALNVSGTASNVQAELDDRYTKSVSDQLLANKVDTEDGKGLSTNDFTDGFRFKLNNIEDNANNYVLPPGTQTSLGGVMGDGTTFTIDENGYGHAIGGGGGGTADYNALINKPKVNGKTVSGDNDSEYYGIIRPLIVITTEAGSTVSIRKGTEVIVAEPKTSTTWEVHPTSYGIWTVESDLPGADIASDTITIDAVKTYAITVNHITATITATYQNGAVCTCSKGSTVYTATSNPQIFTVRSIGTWVVETVYDGITKSASATISADGDSQSVTLEYATINITYGNAFRGVTITCTDGTTVYTKTAPTTGNTMSFTVATSGTWTVSGTVGGDTYTQSVAVSSMTTYSVALNVFNATVTITFPYTEGASCTLSDGVTTLTASTSPMAFGVPNVGTWVATCTLDGQAKTESFVITTDGQTESHTFTYGTINLTYDNEFRGLTLTCNDGVTTISKLAPSTGNTMAFYPPNTGDWTITGTYSGTPYSVDAEVADLSVAVSAQLRTYVVATVTLHGAVEATITYVDVSGVHTQVLDGNGEKSGVTITCLPTNPYVTFVDSDKSKVPEKLDEPYFRRYEITSATTDIYVIPDNSLYWYGYDEGVEDMSNANGWTNSSGYSFVAPTHNKNNISFVAGSSKFCGVGSKNTKTITNLYSITNGTGGSYLGASSAKDHNLSPVIATDSSGVIAKFTLAVNGVKYGISGCSDTGTSTMYALYYDTTTPTTPTYYSAACDVIYIKDSSDNIIPIAYTDSEGKCYDAISLPSGTYTFYSSVAKNPDNLSESYSKTVTITSATTEVRVMPSNVLYWWGYEDNLDNPSKWPNQTNNVACTQNKNSYTASPNSGFATIGKKNFTGTLSKAHCIMKTSNKNNTFLFICGINNDNNSPGANNTIEHLIVNNTNTGTFDIGAGCQQGTTATIYAMWYE